MKINFYQCIQTELTCEILFNILISCTTAVPGRDVQPPADFTFNYLWWAAPPRTRTSGWQVNVVAAAGYVELVGDFQTEKVADGSVQIMLLRSGSYCCCVTVVKLLISQILRHCLDCYRACECIWEYNNLLRLLLWQKFVLEYQVCYVYIYSEEFSKCHFHESDIFNVTTFDLCYLRICLYLEDSLLPFKNTCSLYVVE